MSEKCEWVQQNLVLAHHRCCKRTWAWEDNHDLKGHLKSACRARRAAAASWSKLDAICNAAAFTTKPSFIA